MITRRDIALGGLLSIGWLAASCGCAAHAAPAPHEFGCTLADDEADAVFAMDAQALTAGASPTIVEFRRPRSRLCVGADACRG